MLSRRVFGFATLAGLLRCCTRPVFAAFAKEEWPTFDGVDTKPAGPLVGSTTATSSSLWMYTPGDVPIDVRYRPVAGGPERTANVERISMEGLELAGRAWRASFEALAPETKYVYRVLVNGEPSPEHEGHFATAPKAGEPARFRLGLTSCMKLVKPQKAWPLFLAEKPDLHLTIGDTVYADTTDPAIQWRYHLQYRQSPAFAEVVRSLPTYSLWDDHDFGPNNSDGQSAGKEGSLSGWQRVWGNPGAGTDEVPGAFYRFAWGDVDIFVVDGRYHRTPNKAPDDERKTMLGPEQLDGLKSSRASFKLVVSGSPLDHSLHDGWRLFTHERHRLFDAIRENRIPGVVYLSGSLHRCLTWEHHESDRVGYPFVEVISSGIANSKRLGFALLDFDTTKDDPEMTVRIVQASGRAPRPATWRRSQLSRA